MSIEEIAEEVSFHTGVKVDDLRKHKRVRTVSWPRHIAMYLCRELTSASFPEIAAWFGGRHHTTVIGACRNVKKLWLRSGKFAGTVDGIKLVLEARAVAK